MNTRREISKQYKERKLHGGVYTITNMVTTQSTPSTAAVQLAVTFAEDGAPAGVA